MSSERRQLKKPGERSWTDTLQQNHYNEFE
jgi:hypothetical protein